MEKGGEANVVEDKKGRALSSRAERKNRWTEHFEVFPPYALEVDKEWDAVVGIDTGAIRKEEIVKAMKNLRK